MYGLTEDIANCVVAPTLEALERKRREKEKSSGILGFFAGSKKEKNNVDTSEERVRFETRRLWD